MNPLNPSGPFLFEEETALVWREVYAGQQFEWNWPALPQAGPVVHVVAAAWPDTIVDLDGLSGAYATEALFTPTVQSAINHQLTAYLPDPAPFRELSYLCEYADGSERTWTVRVWQDYRVGRDWILTRLANHQQAA